MTIVNNYIKVRKFSIHNLQLLFSAIMENWYLKIDLNNYEELLRIFHDSKHHWNFAILNHSGPKKHIHVLAQNHQPPASDSPNLEVERRSQGSKYTTKRDCKNDAASSVQALIPTIEIPPQTKPLDDFAVSDSKAVCLTAMPHMYGGLFSR